MLTRLDELRGGHAAEVLCRHVLCPAELAAPRQLELLDAAHGGVPVPVPGLLAALPRLLVRLGVVLAVRALHRGRVAGHVEGDRVGERGEGMAVNLNKWFLFY